MTEGDNYSILSASFRRAKNYGGALIDSPVLGGFVLVVFVSAGEGQRAFDGTDLVD